MTYTDGFVIPVPTKNLDAYREMASAAAEIWREYGALDYKECVGEDLQVDGEMGRSFIDLLDLDDDESVIFAWIVYESREERDRINTAIMNDPRMDEMFEDEEDMPFDPKKMVYGGFDVLVE